VSIITLLLFFLLRVLPLVLMSLSTDARSVRVVVIAVAAARIEAG
jgi:hypothetical protein